MNIFCRFIYQPKNKASSQFALVAYVNYFAGKLNCNGKEEKKCR